MRIREVSFFFEFVRVLAQARDINPDVRFLLENVRMKKEHEAVITGILGCKPVRINSALVSAQNRRRLYWTNIADDIPQPEDQGIYLKDILQDDVTGYDISDKALARILRKSAGNFGASIDPEKTGPINTRNNSAELCIDAGTTLINCLNPKYSNGDRTQQQDRVYDPNGKYPALLVGVGSRNNIMTGVTNYDGYIAASDKSNCIDANFHKGPDNHGQRTFVMLKNTVPEVAIPDKSYAVTCKNNTNSGGHDRTRTLIYEAVRFRRLTEIECERLQTAPDNYTRGVSSTQRYRMLGNGWNIDTIVHILNYYKP